MNSRSNIRKLFSHNETYLLIVVILFSMVLTIINPVFFTLENLFDLLRSSSGTALLALGVFVVLLSGGIDVSFATIAIMGQYISVNVLMKSGIDNIWFAFAVSCLLGVSLGAINALLISAFKLPTLITTLGTSSLYHGLMLEFVGTKAVNVGFLPNCYKIFGKLDILTIHKADGTTFWLSIYFLILVVMIVIAGVYPQIHNDRKELRNRRQYGSCPENRFQYQGHPILCLLLCRFSGRNNGVIHLS